MFATMVCAADLQLIREIERRTGLPRNTIKKYLKAGTIEPKFATPERITAGRVGACRISRISVYSLQMEVLACNSYPSSRPQT